MKIRTLFLAVLAATIAGLGIWYAAQAASGNPVSPDVSSISSAAHAPESGAALQVAEGFEWFWTLDGPRSSESGEDMAADDLGNVFIAAHHGGIDMDRDGALDVLGDESDPLFMKLGWREEDQRVRLQWMRSFSAPGLNRTNRIAPDRSGGAYVLGGFRGTVSFSPGPTLTGRGENDSFFARYGPDGDVLWARSFGGPGQDFLRDVESDASGNAVLTGAGSGSFALDDRGTMFTASSESTAFIASFDPDGAVRWIRMLEGIPTPTGLAIAPDGEIWISGEFEEAVDFDGDGAADLAAPTDRDGFYARFDGEGEFLDAWSLGAGPGFLAFTDDGELFLLGALGERAQGRYGPADFDGDGRADLELRGEGADGMWAARSTREGRLHWIRAYDLERPGGAATDGDRLVVAGSYHGVRDLDEDGVPERVDRTVDPSQESEMAILVLSGDDGRPERVWTAPGPGRDHAGPVVFHPGRPLLYVSGYIQLTADFTGDGEDGEGWARCESLGDLFFAQYRLGEPDAVTGTQPVAEARHITLTASLREVSGAGLYTDLTWSGAMSGEIDVYRNGERILTTANDEAHTDEIPRGTRGPFHYRICEAGTSTCSDEKRALIQ